MGDKQVIHIIDEGYFGREYPEQGLIVVFKKPLNDQDFNNKICSEIIVTLDSVNGISTVTDLIDRMEWGERTKKVIEKTLYLRKDGENKLCAEDINLVKSRIGRNKYDELYQNNKKVATVFTGKVSPDSLFFVALMVAIVLVLLGVKHFLNIKETNRLKSNQEAYRCDTISINKLDSIVKDAFSVDKPYYSFIPVEAKDSLISQISSLRCSANDYYEQTMCFGVYKHIVIDENNIIKSKDQIVYRASLLSENDSLRMQNNIEAYKADIININRLDSIVWDSLFLSHPYSVYISDEEKEILKNQVDYLRIAAKANYDIVKDSGFYVPVGVDEKGIEDSVYKCVEDARKRMEEEEMNRVNNNAKAFQKDTATINSLKTKLADSTSKPLDYYPFINKQEVKRLDTILESLNRIAVESYNNVREAGLYKPISIDSVALNKAILVLVKTTKKKKQQYDNHINNADSAYKKYFSKEGTKADADTAIKEYKMALRIKYDSAVSERCEKLKEEREKI